jgi:sodium transport system permease protein
MFATNIFDIFENISFSFSFEAISLAFATLIAFSLFISGVSIAIASLSKTYKEAQSALTPVSLAPMVPMFLGMLEISVTFMIASIPIVSHVMILNDIFTGTIDYAIIGTMLLSTIVFTIAVVMYIGHQYRSEKVLFN